MSSIICSRWYLTISFQHWETCSNKIYPKQSQAFLQHTNDCYQCFGNSWQIIRLWLFTTYPKMPSLIATRLNICFLIQYETDAQALSKEPTLPGRLLNISYAAMPNPISFRYFKTSPEIIQLAVLLYVRFPRSLRNEEDLLHERGVDVSYESVWYWWHRFGLQFASQIKKCRAGDMQSSNWKWHLG